MPILLGIAEGFTAGVRQRMMKCAALLGSYEEAVQMLADEGRSRDAVPGGFASLGATTADYRLRFDTAITVESISWREAVTAS